VVNVMAYRQAPEVLFCGRRSGRDLDKFAAAGLTAVPAEKVAAADTCGRICRPLPPTPRSEMVCISIWGRSPPVARSLRPGRRLERVLSRPGRPRDTLVRHRSPQATSLGTGGDWEH
jgi:hypothetical protein